MSDKPQIAAHFVSNGRKEEERSADHRPRAAGISLMDAPVRLGARALVYDPRGSCKIVCKTEAVCLIGAKHKSKLDHSLEIASRDQQCLGNYYYDLSERI